MLCLLLLIVCSDADLKLAASNIIKGGFSYSGQRCTAVKVVLVMEDVADELVQMVRAVGGGPGICARGEAEGGGRVCLTAPELCG